ncbi:MADS-box transcription factor family protein [Striga hermonthica]|uniref:MADS-box transcription factor family protein n=1 Tax=Striga hermonthica TaxID=68872 RepID=A0A9N7RFZ3_STRHE|nr:MADS-box transcription factor family protein [Striga hermonthica]
MGRRKLRMQLIADKKSRLRQFEKRKKALEKAAHELSTLCGVEIGMIVYGPERARPEIWPREATNQHVLPGLIDSYVSTLGHEGRNKAIGLADFFVDRAEEAEDELRKVREKSRPARYPMPGEDRYNCMRMEELEQFCGTLAAKIQSVRGRIDMMKGSGLGGPTGFCAGQYNVGCSGGGDDGNALMMMMMMGMTSNGQGQYGNYACGHGDGGLVPNCGFYGVGGSDGGDAYGFGGHVGNYAYGFGLGVSCIGASKDELPMVCSHEGQIFEQPAPAGSYYVPGIAIMHQ